jgi:hypothetical protein
MPFFLSSKLLDLSDNFPEQAQSNTVVPPQKEMDRVGVEPTTSANHSRILISSGVNGELVQIPPGPLCMLRSPYVKRSFEKKSGHKGVKAHIIEHGPFNALKPNKRSKLISYTLFPFNSRCSFSQQELSEDSSKHVVRLGFANFTVRVLELKKEKKHRG